MCVGEGEAVLTIVCTIVTVGATLVIMLIAVEVGSRVDDGDIVESNAMKQVHCMKLVIIIINYVLDRPMMIAVSNGTYSDSCCC